MLFNSLDFIIFFPIVVLIYFIIPQKIRYIWLLVSSYYFYMCWNPTYAILMAFSSIITFASGLLIEFSRKRHPDKTKVGKCWVALSLIINLSILFFFKYFNFIVSDLITGIGNVFPELGLRETNFSLLLPVGISFYTFQALSYTIDAYRGDVKVERNILRYCVFVSFFPQLVAGPIERSSNLLGQFYVAHRFEWEKVKNGLMLMLWGYFQKMVIADRAAIIVNQVFDHYLTYSGFQLLFAALLFAAQIYCDFAGYSNIAIGAAQVMGYDLMKNFNTPYFSRSIAEFWRRWHISLSSWFRDYLYIPLGGSRCSKSKKYRNIMIVFLASGLWHGAGWTFIVWGGLNGIFQIIGQELAPVKNWWHKTFNINKNSLSFKIGQMLITFALVDFAWVFFRATTLDQACGYLARMVTTLNLGNLFGDALFQIGLSSVEVVVLLSAILVLFFVSLLKYKGIELRNKINNQGLWLQYVLCLGGLFAVLIFGIYGPAFDASQFIYFQF